MTDSSKPQPASGDGYKAFRTIGTRWMDARGHFVHVYVDRATRRPAPLPGKLRSVLEALQ